MLRIPALMLCAAVVLPAVSGGELLRLASGQQDDDLDAFMEKVLERRLTNWEDLYKYTVRDRESFEAIGPGGVALESYRGEHIWYVRDGYMVRSPYKINGAKVGDKERERSEQKFLRRMKRRDERRDQKRRDREAAAREAVSEAEAVEEGEPDALEREYFLGFPFEPGNYYVAGWEELEGLELVKIEYFPEKLFEDEDEEEPDEDDAEWLRRLSKTSLVTLWVLPEAYQIVKVRYDNVSFDFLPMHWLFQVDDLGAEMIMHKPFDDLDVWLPRQIRAFGKATLATGSYGFEYALEYYDYKETDVAAKVRFHLPGLPRQQQDR